MPRIRIEDLPETRELSEDDLDAVSGGISTSFSPSNLQPNTTFGSFSITRIPPPGVTVAGVRG